MGTRALSKFVLLSAIYTLFHSSPLCAQIPRRLQQCLPYPTLAQEINDMDEEVEAKIHANVPKVVVDNIRLRTSAHLPNSTREQLVASLKHREFDDDYNWLDSVRDIVRSSWMDLGYYSAKVTANAKHIGGDAEHQHFSLTVRVHEGPQYRLGNIRFRDADSPAAPTVFPSEKLRKLVPQQDGEIFNVRRIREGVDALTKLFGSEGYIDFTATPEMDADPRRQRISIVMELQEGPQFRVGKMKVLGLEPSTENLLKSKLKPGDLFNFQVVDDFYKENKALLPADASTVDDQLQLDARKGTVDLLLDFRSCPQFQN